MGKKPQWSYWQGGGKPKRGGDWWDSASYGSWAKAQDWEDYPTYTRAPAQKPSSVAEAAKEPTPAAGLVKAVQRLVTVARKAEVKTRKATEDREHIEQEWVRFQADLKKKFIKAREQYRQDSAKADQQLAECQEAQAIAFSELQEAMANPDKLVVKQAEPTLPAADPEWDALLGGAEDSDEEMTTAAVEHVRNRLREVMATTPPRRPAVPPLSPVKVSSGQRRATTTPLLEAMVAGKEAPGFGVEPDATVASDPYLTSPSARRSMPSLSPTRRRSRSSSRRTPIKQQGKAPTRAAATPSLGSKLEAARAGMTQIHSI